MSKRPRRFAQTYLVVGRGAGLRALVERRPQGGQLDRVAPLVGRRVWLIDRQLSADRRDAGGGQQPVQRYILRFTLEQVEVEEVPYAGPDLAVMVAHLA